jgi:hypothetical protein
METKIKCLCAINEDQIITAMLCTIHAEADPCDTFAMVTGRRRRGSIIRGKCSRCGWIR